MGIDGMRVGGGRCPPLIVAGLLVACFLLVCNWWSLSTENTELLRQIDGLSQQLKSSVEQGDQCVTQHRKLEDLYKRTEEDIATLHVQLGQEKDSITRKDEAVSMCNIKLDSQIKLDVTKTATIEALRLKEETTNEELSEQKEVNKKLQAELEKVQDELNRLKLSRETVVDKDSPAPNPPVLPRNVKPSAPQLGPVPEGAVEVSPSGQQGIRHYGIPVLPSNPPGAVRQPPRFSVTILKAAGETVLTNETQTGGDRDTQNVIDAGDNHGLSNEIEAADIPENLEEDADAPQDSPRDQIMNLATDSEFKPNPQEEN